MPTDNDKGVNRWHANDCPEYRPRPTAPPAESVEDARVRLQQDAEDLVIRHGFVPNRLHPTDNEALAEERREKSLASIIAGFAEQYATKQIERQTSAIIERCIDEVQDVMGAWGGPEREVVDGMMTELFKRFKAMQTVKARREGGEGK